jgi:hypothetical protein
MASKAKKEKQVQVIARYALKHQGKHTGIVCYLVRASDGQGEYCVTIARGRATGCTCKAYKKPCYHMSQCQEKEAARNASVPTVATIPTTESIPTAQHDILHGSLNSNRAFSLYK